MSVAAAIVALVTRAGRDDEADWVLTSQRQVVSRPQALTALSLTRHGLQHRIRPGGPWRRLLPGIYLAATGEPSWEQLAMAAQLYAGPGSLITGLAALRFHEIRSPQTDYVDVLTPRALKTASCDFVVIHRTRRMPQNRMYSLATTYAPPARAVADAVGGLKRIGDARTIVASAVQQHQCSLDQLTRELGQRRRPGSDLLRTVLAEVQDGIRSGPEGDLRTVIAGSGLPKPLYNADLYVQGKFLARPDAWWQEAGVAAEVDSREWHLLPEDWARTMRRHDQITGEGILLLHFTPRQLRDQPDLIVSDIRAALRNGRPLPWISTRPAAA
jgi:hypothetical protein